MATPNIQLIFQAVLAMTNNLATNAPQIGTFDFANPTLGATSVYFNPYFQAGAGGSAVTLPVARVFAIFVQNLSASASLQVTYNPFGGSPTSTIYGPGGLCVLFDPAESGTGFSTLILAGQGSTVPAMVLVGA